MNIDRGEFFCFRAKWPWGRRQIFQGGAGQESKSSGPVGENVKPYRVRAFSGWGRAERDRAWLPASNSAKSIFRGGICQCRHCWRQCKIFVSSVNFSIFTHFFVFLSLKLLKLGEIDGVKFLA